MRLLTGARMYYSLMGPYGMFLGAKARFARRTIQIAVETVGVKHPIHLRLRTADVSLCQQILVDAQYDSVLSMRPKVIVDAGANIGLASVFYANRYPDAKIIAIEPEPSNYEMLTKNVAPYPNVVPIQGALWNKKKVLSGSSIVSGHHAFQVREEHGTDDAGYCGSIRGLSLRELMTDLGIQQIDLLKVDIEGSEKEVFQNSATWIDHVGVIAIEIHESIRSGCSESVYSAARDFELRWQRGETTYFARTGTVPYSQVHPNSRLPSGKRESKRRTPKFPMKIIQVI